VKDDNGECNRVSDIRQIHTAKLLEPDPSNSEVEIAIEKIEKVLIAR
jgi:hypothetical protein